MRRRESAVAVVVQLRRLPAVVVGEGRLLRHLRERDGARREWNWVVTLGRRLRLEEGRKGGGRERQEGRSARQEEEQTGWSPG